MPLPLIRMPNREALYYTFSWTDLEEGMIEFYIIYVVRLDRGPMGDSDWSVPENDLLV